MPETRSTTAAGNNNAEEIEQLRQQIAQLQNIVQGTANVYHIPDPIKQLSEYTGNKKELNSWLHEVDDLYEEFKVKGENNAPDTFNAHYFRAIKNKIKGEARTVICANGNPSTIHELKRVLREHFGDQRDFATNLNSLFHLKKGERSNTKFYNEIKELNTKIKSNLQLHPITANNLIEIITVTKFLDGISEPLASIIRNSKPKNLDDAYQAVIINQNAEVRKPLHKQKYDNAKPPFYNSANKPKYDTKPHEKYVQKKPFPHKPRAEVNNNELEERVEDEEEEEVEVEEPSTDEECDELNFQKARLRNPKT